MARRKTEDEIVEANEQENGVGTATMDKPRARRRKSDRSNPPFYLIVGRSKQEGGFKVLGKQATIGRIKRLWENIAEFAAAGYDEIVMVRCKVVT